MNPYSHIVVASKLEAMVHPENVQEYYWGAIAPDIRYLAALQRQQTHEPSQRIVESISEYPHLKSFLQGDLVHCLSDEIKLRRVFSQRFHLSILESRMSRQQLAVILELYHFENERVNVRLSGSYNEVLSGWGLSEAVSTKFAQSINRYITSPSSGSPLPDLMQLLGMENDDRIGKYAAAARDFEKNPFLKNALFFGIRTGRISEQIVSMVASLYQHCGV